MGFLEKIRRHAAVAKGDFAVMFKDVEIPPLPAAVNRIITEINQPEPDIEQLVKLMSSAPEIAANVIKTVNSSLFSLRAPVSDVKQAVTLLGLDQVRSIVIAFAAIDALPKPKGKLFDHTAFWTDSLVRAIMSRVFARKQFQSQTEQAFTASLLADLAIPVLLSIWSDYYEPVVSEWENSPKRLSEIERQHFGWDHAQAAAWIVQSWDFPEEMVCYLGAHNLSMEQIQEDGLADTIIVPLAISALSPSVLKPDPRRSGLVLQAAADWLSMDQAEFTACVHEIKTASLEIFELFGLPDKNASRILDDMVIEVRSTDHKGKQ